MIERPNPANRGRVPFGESTTGQSREALARSLGIRGEVVKILEATNAAHILMDAAEAERLSRHPQVELIEQVRTMTLASTQVDPGWGLDRLDSPTPALDNEFTYVNDGSGQTIYVIDSGLNFGWSGIAPEFDGRAEVVYDVNGGNGIDCYEYGHGTPVSLVLAGETYGVAKGATIKMAKVTTDCTGEADDSAVAYAFNWLAANAPPGTIVNFSMGYHYEDPFIYCDYPATNGIIEKAIKTASANGIIIVASAGNDGCNVADFTPARLPEVFVVGATTDARLDQGQDEKWLLSRTGWNISTFSPGHRIDTLSRHGLPIIMSGTSFAAPYMSGMFALACQHAAPYCSSGNTAEIYEFMRATATAGTVTESDGTPVIGAHSRFIRQQW